MRLLILIISLWALAYAKPEMYKEKEDFQYSRSSSDEGSKSGFYGAQRGNMGGNYEKAHNMDTLAQHQMSNLVRQTDVELGEGANTRTGSIFTSGNSRGIYGSGNYDLSNLKGRSFEESGSFSDSQSQSSFSSQNSGYSNSYSAANNARYTADQLRALGLTSQYVQSANQQAGGQYGGASNYEYGNQGATNYYYTHGGSQAQNVYDRSNSNLYSVRNNDESSSTKSRIVTSPFRLYLRPGTRIAIPVTAQTYDASQNALVRDQSTVNTEAELLTNGGQRINVIKPTSNAKHYESAYSYHKEWEKHDTLPVTVTPTENPYPQNSELYEDSQLSQTVGNQFKSEADSTNTQTSNINNAFASKVNAGYKSAYSANTKSTAASRSQYQSQQQNTGSNVASNAHIFDSHNSGLSTNLNSLVEDINTRPKSYQSSYSYHKSWERHGDPYVIKPAGGDLNSLTSQRLVVPPVDQNLYYGKQFDQMCDLQCHLRKKRSYRTEHYTQMHPENFNSQYVDEWLSDIHQNLGQHTQNKWDTLENLGQETQNGWGDLGLGQQTQNKWDNLENLGQETQNQWGNMDLGQQTQNKWDTLDSFNQHSESGVEDLSQKSQSQLDHLENLGQETQNTWNNLETLNQQPQGIIDDIGQQSQSQLDNLQDLGQQTQNLWNNLETLNQKPQSDRENLGQETQNTWDNLETLNQHSEKGDEEIGQKNQSQLDKLEDLGQQTQNTWNNLESLNQKPQTDSENLGQETQNTWNNLETLNQQPQNNFEDVSQQTQSKLDHLQDLGQQEQNMWQNLDTLNQKPQVNIESLGQETQNTWNNLESLNQHAQNGVEDLGQKSQMELDNFEDLGQQSQNTWKNLDSLNQHPQNVIRDIDQQRQSQLDNIENIGQEKQQKNEKFTPQLDSKDQQTFDTWNIIENQQSRNKDEQTLTQKVEHLGGENQSETKLDQSNLFQQSGYNIWNNINSFESQHNTESQTFQHSNQNQRTNERSPISNNEKNLWDIIDKAISDYDKEYDINHKTYTTYQDWEQKHNAESNYYHNSHHLYQHHSFENKESSTEKRTVLPTESKTPSGIQLIEPRDTTTEKIKITEKPDILSTGETKPPTEIGRGDIGADEIPLTVNVENDQNNDKKADDAHDSLNSNKLYKTQDEIESLSLTHINENQNEKKKNQEEPDTSVIGLDQQYESINTPNRKPKDNNFNSYRNINDQTSPKLYTVSSYRKPVTHEREPTYEDLQKSEVQIPDNFEQQNLNQQWFDSEQQISNMQDIKDFGQQIQEPVSVNLQQQQQQNNFDKHLDIGQENINKHEFNDYKTKETLKEEKADNVNNLQSLPKKEEILEQPVEPTEKPGFWKSVWSKTVNAKDKVVSWFKN